MLRLEDKEYQFLKSLLTSISTNNVSLDSAKETAKIALNYIETFCDDTPSPIVLRANKYVSRINVIKELRDVLCLGLKEAKDMTETYNHVIYTTYDIQLAVKLYKAIKPYCNVVIEGGGRSLKLLFGDKNE